MGVLNSRGVPSQSVEAWWGRVEPARLRNVTAASWMHPVNHAGTVQRGKLVARRNGGWSPESAVKPHVASDDAGTGAGRR
jgi:hypothetical protein